MENGNPIDVSGLIHQGDFCEISSEELGEAGINKGDYVFIAGHQAFPISREDMYTQRIQFLCHKCDSEGNVDLSAGFFVIDPSSMFRLGDEQQTKMYSMLQEQIEESQLAITETASESIH